MLLTSAFNNKSATGGAGYATENQSVLKGQAVDMINEQSPSLKNDNIIKIESLEDTDNLNLKFKMAYKGISKADIIQSSTKDIFNKI